MPYLCFDALVPNGHVTVTEDGLLYAVELCMIVTGKNRKDASKILRDLPEEVFKGEKLLLKSFPGKGNGRTKLVSLKDAIELIMVLPGKTAKEYRQKFADIIQSYLAGDTKLIEQIEANAVSAHPVNRLAREALAGDGEALAGHKRLRDDVERMVVCSRELKTNAETAAEQMREHLRVTKEHCEVTERHGLTILEQLRVRDRIESEAEARKLQHERDMLEVARARAALGHPSAPSAAPAAGPEVSAALPAGHTTVLRVYNKHKASFNLVNARQSGQLLRSAGAKAKAEYERLHGAAPGQVREGPYSVYCYPETFEPVVVETLRSAARGLLGQAQTITAYMPVVLSVSQ